MSSETAPRNWWSRNWKWFVPTGCFTVLLLGAGIIVAFVLVLFGAMKSSDVYQIALRRAQSNRELQRTLGVPITSGMFLSGSIDTNNGLGQANLSFPISGPKGSATVYVVASKPAGRWIFSALEAEVKNQPNRVDLKPIEIGGR